MNAANDRGPPRYIFERVIDVCKIAEQLSIDECTVRELALMHEKEISEEISKIAIELIEEIGIREGRIAISEFDEDYFSEICASLT